MEEKQWKETAASDGSGKKSWNLKVVMHCPKCGGTKLGLKGHHLARRVPEECASRAKGSLLRRSNSLLRLGSLPAEHAHEPLL